MFWIALIIPLLIAWWVASDASKRGYNKGAVIAWFLGVWLMLIIFLPLYFILRSKPAGSIISSKRPYVSSKGPYVCPYCGNLYHEKASFCPYCGRKLEEEG